jgi:hypothetical protein
MKRSTAAIGGEEKKQKLEAEKPRSVARSKGIPAVEEGRVVEAEEKRDGNDGTGWNGSSVTKEPSATDLVSVGWEEGVERPDRTSGMEAEESAESADESTRAEALVLPVQETGRVEERENLEEEEPAKSFEVKRGESLQLEEDQEAFDKREEYLEALGPGAEISTEGASELGKEEGEASVEHDGRAEKMEEGADHRSALSIVGGVGLEGPEQHLRADGSTGLSAEDGDVEENVQDEECSRTPDSEAESVGKAELGTEKTEDLVLETNEGISEEDEKKQEEGKAEPADQGADKPLREKKSEVPTEEKEEETSGLERLSEPSEERADVPTERAVERDMGSEPGKGGKEDTENSAGKEKFGSQSEDEKDTAAAISNDGGENDSAARDREESTAKEDSLELEAETEGAELPHVEDAGDKESRGKEFSSSQEEENDGHQATVSPSLGQEGDAVEEADAEETLASLSAEAASKESGEARKGREERKRGLGSGEEKALKASKAVFEKSEEAHECSGAPSGKGTAEDLKAEVSKESPIPQKENSLEAAGSIPFTQELEAGVPKAQDVGEKRGFVPSAVLSMLLPRAGLSQADDDSKKRAGSKEVSRLPTVFAPKMKPPPGFETHAPLRGLTPNAQENGEPVGEIDDLLTLLMGGDSAESEKIEGRGEGELASGSPAKDGPAEETPFKDSDVSFSGAEIETRKAEGKELDSARASVQGPNFWEEMLGSAKGKIERQPENANGEAEIKAGKQAAPEKKENREKTWEELFDELQAKAARGEAIDSQKLDSEKTWEELFDDVRAEPFRGIPQKKPSKLLQPPASEEEWQVKSGSEQAQMGLGKGEHREERLARAVLQEVSKAQAKPALEKVKIKAWSKPEVFAPEEPSQQPSLVALKEEKEGLKAEGAMENVWERRKKEAESRLQVQKGAFLQSEGEERLGKRIRGVSPDGRKKRSGSLPVTEGGVEFNDEEGLRARGRGSRTFDDAIKQLQRQSSRERRASESEFSRLSNPSSPERRPRKPVPVENLELPNTLRRSAGPRAEWAQGKAVRPEAELEIEDGSDYFAQGKRRAQTGAEADLHQGWNEGSSAPIKSPKTPREEQWGEMVEHGGDDLPSLREVLQEAAAHPLRHPQQKSEAPVPKLIATGHVPMRKGSDSDVSVATQAGAARTAFRAAAMGGAATTFAGLVERSRAAAQAAMGVPGQRPLTGDLPTGAAWSEPLGKNGAVNAGGNEPAGRSGAVNAGRIVSPDDLEEDDSEAEEFARLRKLKKPGGKTQRQTRQAVQIRPATAPAQEMDRPVESKPAEFRIAAPDEIEEASDVDEVGRATKKGKRYSQKMFLTELEREGGYYDRTWLNAEQGMSSQNRGPPPSVNLRNFAAKAEPAKGLKNGGFGKTGGVNTEVEQKGGRYEERESVLFKRAGDVRERPTSRESAGRGKQGLNAQPKPEWQVVLSDQSAASSRAQTPESVPSTVPEGAQSSASPILSAQNSPIESVKSSRTMMSPQQSVSDDDGYESATSSAFHTEDRLSNEEPSEVPVHGGPSVVEEAAPASETEGKVSASGPRDEADARAGDEENAPRGEEGCVVEAVKAAVRQLAGGRSGEEVEVSEGLVEREGLAERERGEERVEHHQVLDRRIDEVRVETTGSEETVEKPEKEEWKEEADKGWKEEVTPEKEGDRQGEPATEDELKGGRSGLETFRASSSPK